MFFKSIKKIIKNKPSFKVFILPIFQDPTAAKTKKVVGAKTTKGAIVQLSGLKCHNCLWQCHKTFYIFYLILGTQPTITKFLSSGGGVKVATNTLSVEPSTCSTLSNTCSTLSNTCSAAAKTEISLKPKNAQFRKINKVTKIISSIFINH